jgi:hypothetical protein
MRKALIVGIYALLLASCGGQSASDAPMASMVYDIKAEPPHVTFVPKLAMAGDAAESAVDAAAGADEGSEITTGAEPRIAYSYRYGYRLDGSDIGTVQQKHLALCDALGTAHCHVLSMQRATDEGEFITASLTVQVNAARARAFGASLDKAVGDAGGDVSSRGIEAEDLSKQMVDTAAKITAKQALADRLLVLLQNRSGKVGELVEAERAFAQAQEELDGARSWMAEMQQRVSMSNIEIGYNSRAPVGSGLWRPVRDAFASVGQTLGGSIGTLVSFIAAVLPWLLALVGFIWLARRFGWGKKIRFPWPKRWRRAEPEA